MFKNKGRNPQIYFVPTPIGNKQDITLRALDVLNNIVDIIACEDTRHSLKLLNDVGIVHKKLISLHDHNEEEQAENIIKLIFKGYKIAVISDAGMPLISDPGYKLIQKLQDKNIDYTILPGPSAFTTAVVGSGLSTIKFSFRGFFPRENKSIKKEIEFIKNNEDTSIYYESPYRIKETLKILTEKFSYREFAFAREISKLYETYCRFLGKEFNDDLIDNELKGEFVLLISGVSEKENFDEKKNISEYKEEIILKLKNYETVKDISSYYADKLDVSRKEVYRYILDIKSKI